MNDLLRLWEAENLQSLCGFVQSRSHTSNLPFSSGGGARPGPWAVSLTGCPETSRALVCVLATGFSSGCELCL